MAERTGSLRNYASRVQQALYSSVLEIDAPTSQLVQIMRRPGITRTEQIYSGVQIADNILSLVGIEGFKGTVFRAFHDTTTTPVGTPVNLIGRGFEHNVYMLIDDTSTKPVSYTHLDVYKRQP